MKCPVCEFSMEDGSVDIRGTLVGFLAFGFSSQHLFWQSKRAKRREKLLSSGRPKHSSLCPRCGTLIIPRLSPPSFHERPK